MVSTYLQYTRDVVWAHVVKPALVASRTGSPWFVDVHLPWNRYFTLTLRQLAANPDGIDVRTPRRHVMGPATYAGYVEKYGRLAFRLAHTRFTSTVPQQTAQRVLVYDDPHSELLKLPWRRRIRLRYDVAALKSSLSNWFVAPYTMHPLRYFDGDEDRLPQLRQTKRSVRILFAGNVDPAVYAAEEIGSICRQLGILNRLELYEALVAAMGSESVSPGIDQLEATLVQGARSVLARADRCLIPGESWLRVLAHADFFVCAPGALMPMCHNAVEAMAVGTIPIVAYPQFFQPALQDGITCLSPRPGEDVAALLGRAEAISPSEIQKMRDHVCHYYESVLTARSFIDRLRKTPETDITVFINIELIDQMKLLSSESVIVS